MGFDFRFRLADSTNDISLLIDFLSLQDLGYPKYQDWVQRAEQELYGGQKTGILAFSNNRLVGDLVFQPHKELPRTRELKNIRVHPKLRGRYFANFMLRQAEIEGRDDYDLILCDARTDQHAMINLLRISGYVPIATVQLYDGNAEDVVMAKSFEETSEAGILHRARSLF
ncbi:hypothetical protein GF371_04270 [Candidatus Woesearchaeota archaeon]|nr:hypothetical protein [Candidatus Woesearchaeota archaeon]